MKHTHTTHPAIVKRLKRAHGHLAAVITMIEGQRPCLELAQQLHAVESALANAKTELIHDHIDHCLTRAADGSARKARSTLTEFKALAKYL